MDRIISKETIKKERRARLIKWGIALAALLIPAVLLWVLILPGISQEEFTLGRVDSGSIDVSVSGTGRVSPAYEEIITTPIPSRILEIYHRGGDSVQVGDAILKLDLASIETDYSKMCDQLDMRRYEIEQHKAQSNSRVSDLEMRLKVGEMQVRRKQVELRNEHYLDSIGAGTQDKVREAELGYEVAALEHEQLSRQLRNSRKVAEAELNVKLLEMRMYEKSVGELRRLLTHARITAPRSGVLTFVNTQIGVQVPAGEQLAIVSDLSHFKVEAELADAYGEHARAGRSAMVRIGRTDLMGVISSVTPLSQNGTISLTIQLDNDAHPALRSGLKASVYIFTSLHEEVLRLPMGSYYSGKGEYELFVREGNHLVRRKVQLGESNYSHVEVLSGLVSGDEVVVSDMNKYQHNRKLKIK